MISDDSIVGVIELYRASPELFAALDHGALIVWILGGIAGTLLYLVLIGVERTCSRVHACLEAELSKSGSTEKPTETFNTQGRYLLA
jgi:hypothetical protein